MDTDSIRPNSSAEREMAGFLQRIATGPKLSKPLSREQARRAMTLILEGRVDPVQSACFLIALRMKRETHDELCGVLEALRESADRAIAPVDELVDVAEPYNGHLRHLPCVPFMPALLAACEIPAVLHGCRDLGPKWGLTSHRILDSARIAVTRSPTEAAADVGTAGWAYVDVSRFCPPLHSLARLRTLIVKRPCLALLEKLIQPIAAARRNHLWVGYVHTGYEEILNRLARELSYDSMFALRGIEGGVVVAPRGRVRGVRYGFHGPLETVEAAVSGVLDAVGGIRAAANGLTGDRPAAGDLPSEEALSARAREAAAAGLAALAGRPGPTADAMVVTAALVLEHLGRVEDIAEGVKRAQKSLSDGTARARFEALVQN